jgi:hypothetical protein
MAAHCVTPTQPARQQEMRKILSLEIEAPIKEKAMQHVLDIFRNWCKNEGSQNTEM